MAPVGAALAAIPFRSRLKLLLLLLTSPAALAGVLPEERADALYHYYDGGGVEIDGPSLLVRKSVGEKVSVSLSYYVDTISSASIDVVTTGASPDGYNEKRTQWGTGVDYLRGDTTMSLGYSTSDENDYQADTLNFGISQDVFGGLTTISLGYGSGSDEVSRRGDPTFAGNVDRHAYRLGVTQVVTRNLIMGFSYEAIADEGFLNNPYRRVRYVDVNEATGYGLQYEVYPETRASNAAAIRAKYYLPYRAAISGEYRYFTDDWGIDAHTVEVGYAQPFRSQWIFDFKYRFYTQSAADFYSDLFPYANAQNYLARDKELSTFQSHGPHLGASYTFMDRQGDRPMKSTVNVFADYYMYSYDDFRDLRPDVDVGTEPLYSYDAIVVQAFFSLWF
ncbi:MAG: DUF3570 domain-containing protein [Gammaproteobacteria bacterium]